MKNVRKKVVAVATVATATVILPIVGAQTASAETNLLPHVTRSFQECQTLGNEAAQQGLLTGFNCVAEGNQVIMYPW